MLVNFLGAEKYLVEVENNRFTFNIYIKCNLSLVSLFFTAPAFRDSVPSGKSRRIVKIDKSEDYELRTDLRTPCKPWPSCWNGEFRTDLPNPCEPWPSCWNGGLWTRDP